MNRRSFLKGAAAGAGGLVADGLLSDRASAQDAGPDLMTRRTMGKTGLEVGVVGLGTLKCADKAVVQHAFDQGMNYFDTARLYQRGNAEMMLGEVFAGLPREAFVVTDKVPWTATTPEAIAAEIDTALELLGLEYIDFMLYHKMDSPEMLVEAWWEVAEDYKKRGKIHYHGISTHQRVVDVSRVALERGVDQLLVGYGVVTEGAEKIEDLEAVIEEAVKQGVAVVAMKTGSGKDLEAVKAFREDGMSFYAAALKWPLQNPNVCSVLSEITTLDMVDDNVRAGEPMSEREATLLRQFAARRAESSFLYWDLSDTRCANGVAIAEVLRSRAYYVDYNDLYLARANYHRIPRDNRPDACPGCPACDRVGTELTEAVKYLA